MSGWEYKVVPAPTKGIKARGVKGPEGRFAHAIEALMNDMGAQGWEYLRAETLPSVERAGLTGSTTQWRNLLVFRRALGTPLDDFEPELLPPPAARGEVGDAQDATFEDGAPAQAEADPEQDADDPADRDAGGGRDTDLPPSDLKTFVETRKPVKSED